MGLFFWKKTKNIYQRLFAVQSEIGNIPKNGYNKESDYRYIKANDVIEGVSKLLIKHRIMEVFEELELIRIKEGRNFHSVITTRATFVNVDDTDDRCVVVYKSVAADWLDKDCYKAKTGGRKYLYLDLFKIPNDRPDVEQDSLAEKIQLESNQQPSKNNVAQSQKRAPVAPKMTLEQEINSYRIPFKTSAFKGKKLIDIPGPELSVYFKKVSEHYQHGQEMPKEVEHFLTLAERRLKELLKAGVRIEMTEMEKIDYDIQQRIKKTI